MKIATLFLLALIAFELNAQDVEWRKDQREKVYNDCMSKSYEWTADEDQKSSICLCFLEQIETKYTPSEYANLLSVELKRIESSTVIICSEKLGIKIDKVTSEPTKTVVTETKPVVRPDVNISNYTQEDLVGIWKLPDGTAYLNEDGTYLVKRNSGSMNRGTWYLSSGYKSIFFSGYKWQWSITDFDGYTMKCVQRAYEFTAKRVMD